MISACSWAGSLLFGGQLAGRQRHGALSGTLLIVPPTTESAGRRANLPTASVTVWVIFGTWLAFGSSCGRLIAEELPARIEFNRHVRPILSSNCFRCHGPDRAARKARLRLDRRDGAHKVIVPGYPQKSELIQRVMANNDEVMPPKSSGLAMSAGERAVLRRWIAQGAKYEPHWSLTLPRNPPLPKVRETKWARNPIDRFVIANLERRGFTPAREANKATLLRRVSLALTGLPPTIDELNAFLSDTSPNAYEKAVDRLLSSPWFGERMATVWLDAARYADTNGYFGDNPRHIWPWRDWVIAAFNRNMPFDRFTVEQLAGDLLPKPTLDQRIATGFNRNHMVTDETGVIDEEYRVEYVADRLETTATVWLGLTVGCARCHDHKYDPLTQKEYYQLFAFFNNGPGKGLATAHDPPPVLDLTTEEQRAELKRRSAARREADAALKRVSKALQGSIEGWKRNAAHKLAAPTNRLVAHVPFEAGLASTVGQLRALARGGSPKYAAGILGNAAVLDAMRHVEMPPKILADADRPWTIGIWVKPKGSLNCILSKTAPARARRGIEVLWRKGRIRVHLIHQWGVDAIEVQTKKAAGRGAWHHVVVRYDGSRKAAGVRVFVDGVAAELDIPRDSLGGTLQNERPVSIGRRDSGLGYYGLMDELRVFHRPLSDEEVSRLYWSDRVRGILTEDQANAKGRALLRDYYILHHGNADARKALRNVALTREAEKTYLAQLPKTLVMSEAAKPRKTYLLKRGQYDQRGEQVDAAVPPCLSAAKGLRGAPDAAANDMPQNRLGLARWLTAPTNPLTSRVTVNRLWQVCFGEGLVRTTNDFGAQGEPPTHPDLLDWLAVRFVESGWDVKAMLKLIVTSATYRQSSIPSKKLLALDPDNRLLARGPRFRLPAEMIRDQALFASGLLVERIGGPPVKPYQPPGLWEAVSYDGNASYVPDRGAGLWRRTLYTYWKRQAPPPAMSIFDAPTRETCSVQRSRTNTPAQALVLLNDKTYVEAARKLAGIALAHNVQHTDGSKQADFERLRFAFRRVTVRTPDPTECDVLRGLLQRQRNRFASDRRAAKKLAACDDRLVVERAAWTVVAQVILNLDEVVTSR